ncbi:T9SS type A sorting domain-containing protein [candidate division WOR-3 bacterium]|nr:T9SS type A sorting domain-containing protein [candidate division WOR-3 bacterium]
MLRRTALALMTFLAATGLALAGAPVPAGTEIIELRDEFTKQYSNGDGTITAHIGAAPLHRLNAAGQWVDVEPYEPRLEFNETTEPPPAERAAIKQWSAPPPAAETDDEQTVYPDPSTNWTGYVQYYNYSYTKYSGNIYFRGGSQYYHQRWQGWAKFNLAGIPDGAGVTAATFSYYVYYQSGGPYAYIRNVTSDPVTAGATTIWSQVTGGTQVYTGTANHWYSNYWYDRALNSAGIAAVENGLAQDWCAFGIHEFESSNSYYGRAYGYQYTNKPELTITYTPPGEAGLWVGETSTDWNAGSNWDDGNVPDITTPVIIPEGCTYYPIANSGTGYECDALEIEVGATMVVVAGKTMDCDGDLDVFGQLDVNGTFELAGDLWNEGALTCAPGSEFRLDGDLDAVLNTGVDQLCYLHDVHVAKDADCETETNGDFDINGDLVIHAGNSLVCGGESDLNGHYFIGGDFVNNGSYDRGDGSVTFDSVTALSGTGDFEFNSVTITGELTAADELVVHGDWRNNGTFHHNDGAVFFLGDTLEAGGADGAFLDLEVENSSDGDVVVVGDIEVQGTLTLAGGSFLLASNTLTLGTDTDGGTVLVDAGTFSVVGAGVSDRGVVVAADHGCPYAFAVAPGATIAAEHANFTWMDATGVHVRDGALVDAVHNFSRCSFTQGNDIGAMLTIEGSQVLDDIDTLDFEGTDGYNIDYTLGTGHITVTHGVGGRWGENFDDDPLDLVDWIAPLAMDVGVTTIIGPTGVVDTGTTVVPKATAQNFGEAAADFRAWFVLDDPADAEVYRESLDYAGLEPGTAVELAFPTFNVGLAEGGWTTRCSVYVGGDTLPANDFLDGSFTVVARPPWPEGWHEAEPMPLPPSGRPVKRGGWLTRAGDRLYAAKGYKTQDFYRYDLLADSWSQLEPVPFGDYGGRQREAKKGSRGESDGERHIYYTAGNNTLTFFRYDVVTDSWKRLADVPEGPRRKRVKGGNDLQYVVVDDTGWVYLMKGYKTEFYRFNTVTGFWDTLPDLPYVRKDKWDKGSWLVYDGDRTMYAHQSKYYNRTTDHHYMFRYDIPGDSWHSQALTGMPLYGLHSGRIRKKKSKDGGSAAWYSGEIWALKGGNTQQFWKYSPWADSWTELDTFPNFGSTGRKRRVKYGADIVEYGAGVFYALKGNKTRELWRYVVPAGMAMAARPERSGVMAGPAGLGHAVMAVGPNPAVAARATVRYDLPVAGPAWLTLFDVTGREVARWALVLDRAGTVGLDLEKLNAGIYLLRLESGDEEATAKLVINR